MKEDETTDRKVERHHYRVEVVSAVLLALATIASAFCAYQSTRWHGKEADEFSHSNTTRIHSAEAYLRADMETTIDAAFFSNYAYAYFEDRTELAEFFENDLFSPELREAMDAWKATKPRQNPGAPRTPFQMRQYSNDNLEKARALEEEAREQAARARQYIRYADSYVLLTVLFASVLFFAGISTKFKDLRIKYSLLAGGWVLFIGSLVVLLFLPFPG